MAAASGYDGSITIQAKIDENDFNSQVNGLSGGVKTLGNAFKSFGQSVGGVFGKLSKGVGAALESMQGASLGVLALVGVSILAVGAIIGVVAASIRNLLQLDGYAKGLKTSFENLKLAFATAFQPLVTAALPIIQSIVDWMTKLFITVQMYIAAFLGQKSIMVAVANSAKGAAESTGKLAKNSDKAKKAAEGALAAFDELNVLQMDNNNVNSSASAGGGGSVPDILYKSVPVESKILDTVAKIKQFFIDMWNTVSKYAVIAWDWIVSVWNKFAPWFMEKVIIPVSGWFSTLWENIKTWSSGAWDWIVTTWNSIGPWFQTNVITPLTNLFGPLWNWLSIVANDAFVVISYAWGQLSNWFKTNVIDPLAGLFNTVWSSIMQWGSVAWQWIQTVWGRVGEWFSDNVGMPIQNAFGIALEWVKTKWETIFSTMATFAKGIINNIIGSLNGMIGGIVIGVNALTSMANASAGKLPGWVAIPALTAPKIPYLATGAVIPANAPFAAVLGDQRSGKNIESPVGLMAETFAQVLAEQGGQKITIDFGSSSMGALIQALNPVIKQENNRIGNSFITTKAGA